MGCERTRAEPLPLLRWSWSPGSLGIERAHGWVACPLAGLGFSEEEPVPNQRTWPLVAAGGLEPPIFRL